MAYSSVERGHHGFPSQVLRKIINRIDDGPGHWRLGRGVFDWIFMMAQQDQDTPRGLALAITAYVLWGFLPLYMKLLSHVPAVEIVAHRVICSIPVAGAVLLILRRTKDLREAIRNPRMLAMGCVTAALISVNWGIYVYAISIERAADAALGYYINPLF
jgi:chloramphenicol-sensitive protein RarD